MSLGRSSHLLNGIYAVFLSDCLESLVSEVGLLSPPIASLQDLVTSQTDQIEWHQRIHGQAIHFSISILRIHP